MNRRECFPQGGFTVIEVIAALIILAIAAALTVPAFESSRKGTRLQAALIEAKTVYNAAEEYVMETFHNRPVDNFEVLDAFSSYDVTEPESPLYPWLHDCQIEGGYISELYVNEQTRNLEYLIYTTRNYTIRVNRDGSTEYQVW